MTEKIQNASWKGRIHGLRRCLILALPIGAAALSGCQKKVPDADSPSPESSHAGFAVTPAIEPGAGDLFVDVTGASGISFIQQFCDDRISNILESNGSGAAILDFDQDGWMDIYLVNPGPLEGVTRHQPGTERESNRLYRNQGNGTFEDVTVKAGLQGHGYSLAAVAADFDNDGFPDLYVVNAGGNILYRNLGDGTFEDVTRRAGVGDDGTGVGAVFFDADRDGHLDLFVVNYLTYVRNYDLYFKPDGYPGPLSYKPEFNVLYLNKGDGTFEDVSESSGVRLQGHRGMSVAALDYNRDGATDLYISNDATPNVLLVNDGQGHFQDRALEAMVAFNANGEAAGSMTAAVGDYNGDQLLDLLVSRLGYGSLYTAMPGGMFEDRLMASRLGAITAQYVGWGSNFLDYDNNRVLDAFIANGDAHHMVGWESLLLENMNDGTFTDAADKGGAFFRTKIRARGSFLIDFDNDGRLDVLVTAMGDRVFLLHNRTPAENHWLTLDLEGTRSNRDGFGARITLTAGGKSQYTEARGQTAFLGSSDPRIHFGLGQEKVVEKLEIIWPSGTVQTLRQVPANQVLKVKES